MYQTQSQRKPHFPESTLCFSLCSGFSFNSLVEFLQWQRAQQRQDPTAEGDDVQGREEEDVEEWMLGKATHAETREHTGSVAAGAMMLCRLQRQRETGEPPQGRIHAQNPSLTRFSPRIHRGGAGVAVVEAVSGPVSSLSHTTKSLSVASSLYFHSPERGERDLRVIYDFHSFNFAT
ncbi:hypothetical protein PIB30_027799 [Stylosanthes scabra]|uniref:Uncharacterized protein n=1 Tax=Stylosanthes scabra TaxID=79078 RepID=A0ABU6RBA6_9FABA|nr:hypothetical protein [Stylosanthes scabra]